MPDLSTPDASTTPKPAWDTVLEPHLHPAQIERLRCARVGIIGAGGLGSNAALLLARSGIGHLIIADGDTVSMSNLNRQAYAPKHLGQQKVFALGHILSCLRPDLYLDLHPRFLTCEDIALFVDCDLVLEAVDNPTAKRDLTEALLLTGHHVIAASGMAGWGGLPMSVRHFGSRLTVVGDHTHSVAEGRPPMGPRVLMAASMQADAALCLLLNSTSAAIV